jgi:hypothetical protein
VHGVHHSATLETYNLLAQLYTSTGQYYQKNVAQDKSAAGLATECYKKAVFVHEDLLRWFVNEQIGSEDDDGDDDDTAATFLAEYGSNGRNGTKQHLSGEPSIDKTKLVKKHLRLLKLAFERLGSWPKPYVIYERLSADVFKAFKLQGVDGVEKWIAKGFGGGKAESDEGSFTDVSDWEILTRV